MSAPLLVVFVVAQYAPGQVASGDIEELRPIPPITETLPSPLPSLPPPPAPAAEPGGNGYSIRPGDDGGFVADAGTFTAYVDPEGRVRFEDRSVTTGFSQLSLFGRFGFGGIANAPAKQAFLESTFEQRLAMRTAHGESAMEAALADLPRYLAAVWSYDEWPLATRKRLLFDLWDECAEWGDPDVVAGGREARRIITAFVRRYLPEGSDLAYDEADLRELNNERTSAEPFSPYVLSSGAEVAHERAQPDSDPVDVSLRDPRLRPRSGPEGVRQRAE